MSMSADGSILKSQTIGWSSHNAAGERACGAQWVFAESSDRGLSSSYPRVRQTRLERNADAFAGIVERRAAAVAAVDGGVDLDREQLCAAVGVRRDFDPANHAWADARPTVSSGQGIRQSNAQ